MELMAMRVPGGARGGQRDPRGGHRQSRWQKGQRGSQRARTRAIASRAVANESAKCRSGRDFDRTVWIVPSRRGGKSSNALGHDEGVAAEDDRDVVMPSDEGATLVVIEAELALELLVDALGLPALLDDAHDLLLAHTRAQRRDEELGGLPLAVGPFDDEPDRLAGLRLGAIVVSDLHTAKDEVGGEFPLDTIAPRHAPEQRATHLKPELFDVDRLTSAAARRIQQPDAGIGIGGDGVIESVHTDGFAKDVRAPIEAVGQDDLAGDLVVDGIGDEVQGQVHLGLERDGFGNPGTLAAYGIPGPRLRQVQGAIDGYLLGPGRDAERHADLAVGDLARAPRVLALHTGRVPTLLEHSRVVDDPCGHGFSRTEDVDDVA